MELPKDLKNDIWDYCRANNITNIDEFTLKCLKQGFSVERYGATPVTKIVEKEVEKIVEVPVEKIVEVIKEVPVEKVVEKEVYITDDSHTKELTNKIAELESTNKLNFKRLTDEIGELTNKLSVSTMELEVTKKQLEEEKKKNKKDIYGEN